MKDHQGSNDAAQEYRRHSLQEEELGTSVEEERRGLLSDGPKDTIDDLDSPRPLWSRKTTIGCAVTFIVLILGYLFGRPLMYLFRPSHPKPDFNHRLLRSNGTHDFRKTALIVSIDGLRYVYPAYSVVPAF